MKKAKATITGISRVPGDVTGYPLVELQLDVRPKGQMPYPVTRKFVANRFRRLEPARRSTSASTPPTRSASSSPDGA